jgi:hypothetical protein
VSGGHQEGAVDPGHRAALETVTHAGVFDYCEVQQTFSDVVDEIDHGRHTDSVTLLRAESGKCSSALRCNRRIEIGRKPAPQHVGMFAKATRLTGESVGVIDQDSRTGQQLAPRGGQLGTMRCAPDQLHPEFTLQSAQTLRHRWLSHLQPDRGVAEMSFLGDGDEEPQMSEQIHATTVTPSGFPEK